MATPSNKAPAVTDFLESAFGRTTAIEEDVCAFCGHPATTFTDSLSRKEYTISGLCQDCQDTAFTEPDDEY